jgi:hypothetical protein
VFGDNQTRRGGDVFIVEGVEHGFELRRRRVSRLAVLLSQQLLTAGDIAGGRQVHGGEHRLYARVDARVFG